METDSGKEFGEWLEENYNYNYTTSFDFFKYDCDGEKDWIEDNIINYLGVWRLQKWM